VAEEVSKTGFCQSRVRLARVEGVKSSLISGISAGFSSVTKVRRALNERLPVLANRKETAALLQLHGYCFRDDNV